MKAVLQVFVALVLHNLAFCQFTVSGAFPYLARQQVKLEGSNGFNTYPISAVIADEDGRFELTYSHNDAGMGYLSVEGDKPCIIVLGEENIELKGESLGYPETIEIISGYQNQMFTQYASEHVRREQALSAWIFLERIYKHDSLFALQAEPHNAVLKEKHRIQEEDRTFLSSLNPQSYVHWYLPVRSLVSSVSTIAQFRPEEIPDALAAFRTLDYTDTRLYKSGLLREALESHFWLIENSGRSLDSVFAEMNVSIDLLIDQLVVDEFKFNEITNYLFNVLEKRSLFDSAEYLALKILNEVNCTVNNDLAKQLEAYRKMKKGNTAPDFVFPEHCYFPPDMNVQSLKEIQSEYIVLVFAAGWCGHCNEEMPQIASAYPKWKEQSVEVVLVSLDESTVDFTNFAAPFPFISTCDYLKWDSPIVKDYHVFGTPSMYLLDKDLTILLRPKSFQQMDAWVDWYLVEGNK